ncbi:hypothetical protein KQI84_11385 [bacterium]|nr:hypothetical protein [bacterium]
MTNKMKRNLTGPPGRAIVYLILGLVLFSFVVQGSMRAYVYAYEGLPGDGRRARVEKKPAAPERYVPPADVTYPIY